MEFSFDSIRSARRDSPARTQRARADGFGFVRTSWVEAAPRDDRVACDETHDFLVPTPFAAEGSALDSARHMPERFASGNDLPRLRVFNDPAETTEPSAPGRRLGPEDCECIEVLRVFAP